jgi:hypothetical protein
MYQQLAAERLSTVEEVNRKQSAKAERLTDAWEARAREQFELARRLSYLSPLPPYVYASTALAATGFESRKSYSRQVSAVAKAVWDFAEARFVEERRKNPAFGYNDYLDVSRRPRFHYVPPPFSDRLGDALPFARLLAFWVVGLFAVAVGGFLRFDVR